MSQPSFWCVANLGDVDPLNHGGKFVCVDRTGVYPPELVVIEEAGDSDNALRVKCAVQLDRLTAIKDQSGKTVSLSDNKFHVDSCAWFASSDALADVSSFAGLSLESFISLLLSSQPVSRATGYICLLDYYGCENFGDPRRISVDRARIVCDEFLRQIEETKSWHSGYFSL